MQAGDTTISKIKIIKGCPCFKKINDLNVCILNDVARKISVMELDPAIIGDNPDIETLKQFKAKDNDECYLLTYLNYEDNHVYCISKDTKLILNNQEIRSNDVEEALFFVSRSELESNEICSTCLYKYIITINPLFENKYSREEKAEKIKEYIKNITERIIEALSSTEEKMFADYSLGKPVIDDANYFTALNLYIESLMKHEKYLEHLLKTTRFRYRKERHLLQKRIELVKLEYKFYFQTKVLEKSTDIQTTEKILQILLDTADKIIDVNKSLMEIISYLNTKKRFAKKEIKEIVKNYPIKSLAIEHNFGNLLKILTF